MAEYITKETLLKAVKENSLTKYDWSEEIDVDDFTKVLNELPAADVVPVRRGQWVEDGGGKWHCSECGYKMEVEDDYFDPNGFPIRFCENCGARMGLGGADNGE